MEYMLLGNTVLIISEIEFDSSAADGDEWGVVKDNEIEFIKKFDYPIILP